MLTKTFDQQRIQPEQIHPSICILQSIIVEFGIVFENMSVKLTMSQVGILYLPGSKSMPFDHHGTKQNR